MEKKPIHIPVLQKEVLNFLNPKTNENFIDCTIGQGGHSLGILEAIGPKGKLLGIDWDKDNINFLKLKIEHSEFKKRLILVNDSFANLKEIVQRENFRPISGILFDLGISSWHLEESGRGFTFQKKEPLDMRYNFNNPLTAERILNYCSFYEIKKILQDYGEEKFAENIAKKIIEKRKEKEIKNTFQLIEIIKEAVPRNYWQQKIHFATRTFQALRIAVNKELENLKKALPQALEILEVGGRLVIISFHSLEDRIVKNFFKGKKEQIKILTKKPFLPSKEEIKKNPRSRSAKLRAIIKIN